MKTSSSQLPPFRATRLLDQVRERIRYLHYSIRTEEAYVYWIKAFIRFHKLRHPAEMGQLQIEEFLSWLANARQVAVPTPLHVKLAVASIGLTEIEGETRRKTWPDMDRSRALPTAGAFHALAT